MNDIIAALATPWGEGGIAVVRVSGKGSVELADRIFKGSKGGLSAYPARFMSLGELCSCDSGAVYDEILAVRFEDKRSYTGEESVEFHCHGGFASAQKCIDELCSMGARIAQPGEFTKRAFINGRLDLSQAEAVLGIIRARSDEALSASARTLQGEFTEKIKNFLARLTAIAAQFEVDLDFPEEGEGYITDNQRSAFLEELSDEGAALVSRCKAGLMLREGIRVAIVGKPNVGKSSILNALLNEERAIVTAIPGTTRDRIEERFIHNGVPVKIIDTAGIRETEDTVESIGVTQSRKSINEADICLWVVDASSELSDEELEIGREVTETKHLIVLNKEDIMSEASVEKLKGLYPGSRIVTVSALMKKGIEELKELIISYASENTLFAGSYGVTARQLDCLVNAVKDINEAKNAELCGIGDDVTISCISDARIHLSSLLGLDASEDLLDAVFGSFCVGK